MIMITPSLAKSNAIFFVFLFASFLFSCQSDQTDKPTNETAITETAEAVFTGLSIDKPFEQVTNPTQELLIKNPAKAYTFRLKSGAYIKVPANAFQTVSGEPVQGEVTLQYTKYQDVAEIITSGIPMKVQNENGSSDWMQTGGMFEIAATSQGQAVELMPNKEMEVSIVSTTPGTFDVWRFEEGNWTNLQADHEASPEKIKDEALEKEISILKKQTANPPINPENKDAYKLIFNDLDLKHCPQLKGQSPIALSYAGKDKTKDPKENTWINNPGIWYKKDLKPLDAKAGTYTLTLYGDDLYQIPVTIALQGAALEKAKAKYQQLLAQHKQQLIRLKDREALRAQGDVFRRTLSVARLGIYNYDVLYKEEMIPLFVDFNFGLESNQYKDVVDVYLVTANNTVVMRLPATGEEKFRYVPTLDNKLIAVLPGDKIATFSQSEFKKEEKNLLAAKDGQYVFNMNMEEGTVSSVEDLQGLVEKAGG